MFRNWAGNQECEPASIESPSSAEEVAALIERARTNDQRVKAVGAGHSFTAAAMTDDVLIKLDQLAAITRVDLSTNQVTVGAGMTLHALNVALDAYGLALPNLGDIDVQTVAGATSTATHGTGVGLGNLATQIMAMELVTGTGEVIRCSETERPELLRVARVGLGALGVVTEVTLQAVPSFSLSAVERVGDLSDIVDDVEGFLRGSDHAELFWLPGTSYCQVKQNSRTDAALAPMSRAKYFVDKIVGENIGFGLLMETARRFPSQTERLRSLIVNAASDREFIDKSYKVFASPRHVRFVEMEYGVPLDAMSEVLQRVTQAVAAMDHAPLFPIEVRASAADDIALSTGYGRDSGWIAVHQYKGLEFVPYFTMIESIMDDYEGRPHWGKMHFQTAETLAPRYPEWETFAAVRRELDPDAIFRNTYLDRVLG